MSVNTQTATKPSARYIPVAIMFIAACCMPQIVSAGVFSGIEKDAKNTEFSYIGTQTSGRVFLYLFAANLIYEFTENNEVIRSDNDIANAAVGIHFGNQQNFSLSIGASYNKKIETTLSRETKIEETGGYAQISAASYSSTSNYELLASYSSIDAFVWSRVRYKYRFNRRWTTGIEGFWMGNDDAESRGGGLIFEITTKPVNFALKVGQKITTNNEQSVYGGAEFYFAF